MLWIWKDAQLREEGAPIKATPCSVSGCECKPTLGPSRREWLVHLPPPHRGLSQNPALTQASAPPLPPAPVALLLSVSMATTWAEPASPLPSPQPRERPRTPARARCRPDKIPQQVPVPLCPLPLALHSYLPSCSLPPAPASLCVLVPGPETRLALPLSCLKRCLKLQAWAQSHLPRGNGISSLQFLIYLGEQVVL